MKLPITCCFIQNLSGSFIACDTNFISFVGAEDKPVIGGSESDIHWPQWFMTKEQIHYYLESAKQGENINVNFVNKHPSEGPLSCLLSLVPLKDPQQRMNEIAGLIVVERGELTKVEELCLIKTLLVEDDKVAQVAAENLLKNKGFEVKVVSSGFEALKQFQKNQYSIVFMDIGLKGLDGALTSREMRKIEMKLQRHPALIIALSSDASPKNKAHCLSMGVNDFIVKPLTVDFLEKIKKENVFDNTITHAQEQRFIAETTLDIDKIIENLGCNRETARSLIDDFIYSLPDYLAKIDNLYKNEHYTLLSHLMQRLSGAAAYVNARALVEEAEKIATTINEKGSIDAELVNTLKNKIKAVLDMKN